VSVTTLTPREPPTLPVEAPCITPDRIAGLKEAEVARLPVRSGNEPAELGDIFEVRGDGSEEVRIVGDADRVKRIGAGMARGRIVVEGSVGMHAGAGMKGGVLEIGGDAGARTGTEMAGGVLRVEGDVGDHAGAAAPGSRRGMTGGILLVGGRAGDRLGSVLRRGVIAVRGRAGDDPGFGMIAGSIILCGGAGRRIGAGMKRGSIVGFEPLELLPTFRYACTYRPDYLSVFLRRLHDRFGFAPPDGHDRGLYERYSGDFNELGRGEVLVWTVSSD
jgi:formylmethanofuran dehydrogenase subunit C